eukprot:CAMPEP_0172533634 /NCGR_PEP_ID=MMETSP1067-20121228/6265_1 /TAXON_ID=265564 ORGANISM="Thalassiosira punctigera, Strain Tpunct2005C2" /NCGR_SAMPLE_ID=MMETSP1067 /ASSEMBLY_ACC=CAM_ASM_000444 /LENGTH=766 /DNA_ID=CAMNT_0013318297 /DNA_START=134 /DNA_END=2434 /DNA_ORIENTATION=+
MNSAPCPGSIDLASPSSSGAAAAEAGHCTGGFDRVRNSPPAMNEWASSFATMDLKQPGSASADDSGAAKPSPPTTVTSFSLMTQMQSLREQVERQRQQQQQPQPVATTAVAVGGIVGQLANTSPQPTPTVTSSSLMMQMQHMREQMERQQRAGQQFCAPSVQLPPASNGNIGNGNINMINGNIGNGNMINGNIGNGNMMNGNIGNGNMSNGNIGNGIGNGGALMGGAATGMAPGPGGVALSMIPNQQAQHQMQGVHQLMNSFHVQGAAVQGPSQAVTGANDPQIAFASGGAPSNPAPSAPSSSASPLACGSSNDVSINFVLESLASNKGSSLNVASPNRAKVFHGKGSFPLNLAVMLESVDSMNLSHIIGWLPSGQSFVIHDPDQFLTGVLPKFFKSSKNTKLRSFYRKLNRWGFSILRNHHLTKQGVGSMKGVWHHPEFFRKRALECLKIALETGDTSSFLSVRSGKAEGVMPDGGEAGDSPEVGGGKVPSNGGDGGSLGGKKRRANIPPTNGGATQPSNLTGPLYYSGQPQQRPSHRVSDFSVGDDSFANHLENDNLLSQVTLQAGSLMNNQPSPATADGGGNFSLSNSFTAPAAAVAPASERFNLAHSFTAGNNLRDMQAAATASLMNKQVQRDNVDLSSIFQQYQPVNQAGVAGGNNRGRQATSNNNTGRNTWAAGSTFSQHNFNFPSAPILFNNNNNALMQEQGPGQNQMLSNNDNVERMEQLASMNFQGQTLVTHQAQGEGGEDVELASFFEKFADSLQN